MSDPTGQPEARPIGTPNISPMDPQQYAQERAAASGSSFYYAFRFLPPDRRAAITAFYAFCREVDDVVDETSDPSVAAAKLAWWRDEVIRAYAGQPNHPAMRALMPHSQTYDIRASHLLDVIKGCEMDLQQSRYLDFAGLAGYCHLVAGVVGEVACNIFGRQQEQTVQYAHKLGLAMQLTNIIRDVGEDARRGRIYLPLEDLQRFEVKAHELQQRQAPYGYSDRFQALMAFQAQRSDRLYDEALALLPSQDRRQQRPGLMMANIYRTLLHEVQAGGFQVLHQRVALTPLRKVWIAMQTHWRSR
jgi:15-cis-phytoene synthase